MRRSFTNLLAALALSLGHNPLVSAAEAAPLFSRHVLPLFSRLGCNAGACHGAVKGQNGFRLSLFGAEPTQDYHRLLHDAAGRRLDCIDCDNSLLLRKALGQVSHQGGVRLARRSRDYAILRNWIAAGARLDDVDRSKVTRLVVSPEQKTVQLGDRYPLRVTATFTDGSSEDVTALCTFEASNKDLARIDSSGQVQALGVGDTALIARYRSVPVVAMLMTPREGKEAFPTVAAGNFIDRHILDKLRRLNIHPSEAADDLTFLRRVSLDVQGLPPTPDEVRAFLKDGRANKRQRKIDELLDSPGYSALWATKFCDILRPTGFDGRHGFTEEAESRRIYDWLRARVRENMPYDLLVERILLATSREGRPDQDWVKEVETLLSENAAKTPDLKAYAGRKTLDLYWQRGGGGIKSALQVAHSFLGLRLECCQCHRHPHDVWQQDDLLSFANFFMRVSQPGTGAPSSAVAKEADRLVAEAKGLKENLKKLGDKAKDKSLAKEEMAKLQAEIKKLNEAVQAVETTARRLKATEIHTAVKATFASMTSTLGKQESKQHRLLGDAKPAALPDDKDAREVVMAWLRAKDNPFFAKAIVNRVWAHYFGRGVIDPPDHLSPLNPPSHPELLNDLCADFMRSKYDLKHLHRTILGSRTYQQSAQTNATNRHDTANYASFYLRRLPAEVLVDTLNHATGGAETYPPDLYLPAGSRALEVAGGAGSERAPASLRYAFQILGRPMRMPDGQCDCERDSKPTIVQTLYLTNHPVLQQKIAAPKGRVAQIVGAVAGEGERIDELYLWTLSRPPTADERRTCIQYVKESSAPQRGLEDVLWSLLNTKEFLLNH